MKNLLNVTNIFYPILTWLIILLPTSLVSGPFLANLFATLIALIYLLFFIKNITKNNLLFLSVFLAFTIYLFFTSLIGDTVIFSLSSSIAYLRYGFLILAIYFIATKNKNFLKNFFFVNFIAFIFLFFDVFIQFYTGTNILGKSTSSADRYTSFFDDEQIIGSFVVRVMPIFFFLIHFLFPKKNTILIFIIYSISLITILFSGERSSLVLFVIFALIVLIDKKSFFFTFNFFLILIVAMFFVFLSNNNLKTRFVNNTYQQIFNINDNTLKMNSINKNFNYFSERHEFHFTTAYNIFKKNPLFGSGPNSFRYLCDKPEYSVRNLILENNTFRSKFDGYIKLDIDENDNKNIIIYDNGALVSTEKDLKAYIFDNNIILDEFTIKKHSRVFKYNKNIQKGDVIFIKYFEHENGCNTHPHNIFIQLLSETGIIGAILYLFFFIKICTYIFKHIYYLYFKNKRILSSNYIYLLGGTLINFFPFITTGNFFSSWLCILFSIPIGLLLYIKK